LLIWDDNLSLTINTRNISETDFILHADDCVFPKDLTQYLSRYNTMIERTDLSD